MPRRTRPHSFVWRRFETGDVTGDVERGVACALAPPPQQDSRHPCGCAQPHARSCVQPPIYSVRRVAHYPQWVAPQACGWADPTSAPSPFTHPVRARACRLIVRSGIRAPAALAHAQRPPRPPPPLASPCAAAPFQKKTRRDRAPQGNGRCRQPPAPAEWHPEHATHQLKSGATRYSGDQEVLGKVCRKGGSYTGGATPPTPT